MHAWLAQAERLWLGVARAFGSTSWALSLFRTLCQCRSQLGDSESMCVRLS